MEPNDGKEYPHQYMPQMSYGADFGGYMQNEYGQMPAQSLPGMSLGPVPQIRNQYLAQPQPQMSYQQPPPANNINQSKIKGKRRSKNETEGRNYKCTQCERTYLSYPALYTHIKTKHSSQGETPLTSGRGRGRPKKNLTREERIDPTSPLYFRAEDRKGGPTAVLYQFKETYDIKFADNKKYGGHEKHPLYSELYKLHLKNVNILNYTNEHPNITEFGLVPPNQPAAVYKLKPAEPAPASSSDAHPSQEPASSQPGDAMAPAAKDNSNSAPVPLSTTPPAPAVVPEPAPISAASVAPVAPAAPAVPAASNEAIAPATVPAPTSASVPALPSAPASTSAPAPVPTPAAAPAPALATVPADASAKNGATSKLDDDAFQKKKLKKCDEIFA